MPALRFCLLFACTALAASAADSPGFSARFEELKQAASPAQLYTLLYDLPKGGDLHNHGFGSNIPEWIYTVATDPQRNGGDTFYARLRFGAQPDAIAPAARHHVIRQFTYDQLPPGVRAEYTPLANLTPTERAAWCDALRLDAAGEGRMEFFNVIWTRLGDLSRNPHVRTELLVENIKAFAAEGLRYLETQFGADGFVAKDGRVLTRDEGVDFIRARLARPDVAPILASGFVVRFQDTVLRFAPDAERRLRETYAFVAAHRDLWVGLNMAGIEENGKGYPRRFLDTFRELRRRHPTLRLSIHAGEMDGPDSHVRDTLLLGASRIGHGVNLINDPDTFLLLQQSQRVLVEVNLISNRLLEYTPDLSAHPFPEYLRTGLPVCLNTDDRGMWDSNMTDEYYTAVTTFNLSWDEMVTLGRNSLAYSFAQPDVKARLLADYDARVAAFEARYGGGSVADALARLAAVKPVAYGYAKRTWGFAFAK
ncbi:MAG TPA: hypothetical protein VGD81_04010 [Opitutaceae bacterium]